MSRTTFSQTSILERIGDTSLIVLGAIVPSASIFLKMESENLTGSMKDRMALAMIEAAEKDCRLERGGNVDEYTGGSTRGITGDDLLRQRIHASYRDLGRVQC